MAQKAYYAVQDVVRKVSDAKRRSGTPGARVVPRGLRWWLGVPLLAGAAAFLLSRARRSSRRA